jgi:predicted nucleic acid-binding Zn ribbon protein
MAASTCPRCKNAIRDDDALLCLFCGESLNRPGKRIPRARPLFIAITLLMLLGFISFVFLR